MPTSQHLKERQLLREVSRDVEGALPGVEVVAVELTGNERFCVFVDRPEGVDHALCERVTHALRGYLDEYSVEVSSPGFERPLRTQAHFERALGRRVKMRTEAGGRVSGEVLAAGDGFVRIAHGAEPVEIPYEQIVRANLIEEG
ncbi:MAG: ribosome maturation factor RimP [Steroidobacteraceae bacterium]